MQTRTKVVGAVAAGLTVVGLGFTAASDDHSDHGDHGSHTLPAVVPEPLGVVSTLPPTTVPPVAAVDLGDGWELDRECPATSLRVEASGGGWRVVDADGTVIAGPRALDAGSVPVAVVDAFCPDIETVE